VTGVVIVAENRDLTETLVPDLGSGSYLVMVSAGVLFGVFWGGAGVLP